MADLITATPINIAASSVQAILTGDYQLSLNKVKD